MCSLVAKPFFGRAGRKIFSERWQHCTGSGLRLGPGGRGRGEGERGNHEYTDLSGATEAKNRVQSDTGQVSTKKPVGHVLYAPACRSAAGVQTTELKRISDK